ncbi:helix-turn-helix domain-containing protein [Rhodoferax saidenbachensis]|uniref:AraC family transcriptional regulator n=1 Tax=Rhodoferax saidenbachensis TaxID=1484693 RepID=A0ABU1ZNB0_9BURK|nr:helix-turn-helix domain-containing protein [Rhodoferax saidenbachensis]MDR7307027.1 AraC family transcriptional regulator [Rhodoferax saidenbachensis]
MHYLKRVQQGIDYVEAHLDTEIELSDVAKAAGLSQWHFQRVFRALTNETLKTYIRSRRFAKALDQLLATKLPILDIALAAGYETQESFTRAFKLCFRLTPGQYRVFGNRSLFVKKVELDVDYLRHIHRNVSLVPEVYEQRAMQLVGVRTLFYGLDSEKNNLAKKLPPLWASFLARLAEVPHAVPGVCYGVVSPVRESSDQLQYFAAIEVSHRAELPVGMLALDVPGARYARFCHQGPANGIDNTVNYIYSSWLLNSGTWHAGGVDLEVYDSRYHPTLDTSLMHYAIPIG